MSIGRITINGLIVLSIAIGNAPNAQAACENCPASERPPYPRSGFWYDADRPGSGINLDIQNGILTGSIYTYDQTGDADWQLFSGELQIDDDSGEAAWTLSADLQAYSAGSCLTCEFAPNDGGVVVGEITLRFDSRNSLEYVVGDSESFTMRPFVFGTIMESRIPSLSDVLLPIFGEVNDYGDDGFQENASTPWIILIGAPDGSPVYDTTERVRFYADPRVVRAQTFETEGPPPYEIIFSYFTGPSERTFMDLMCGTKEDIDPFYTNDDLSLFDDGEVFCSVFSPATGEDWPAFYYLDPNDLGSDYFKATAFTGETLEGFRIRNRQ